MLSGRFVFVWVLFFPGGGGVRVLDKGIVKGFLLVLDVSAPRSDYLSGVEALVLSGCQGRGGEE